MKTKVGLALACLGLTLTVFVLVARVRSDAVRIERNERRIRNARSGCFVLATRLRDFSGHYDQLARWQSEGIVDDEQVATAKLYAPYDGRTWVSIAMMNELNMCAELAPEANDEARRAFTDAHTSFAIRSGAKASPADLAATAEAMARAAIAFVPEDDRQGLEEPWVDPLALDKLIGIKPH